MIYKSSFAVYYTDFASLFAVIRHIANDLVFHCWKLNDCEEIDTITFVSLCEKMVLISLGNLSISWASKLKINVYLVISVRC